jgi:predicted transcriptional regulator
MSVIKNASKVAPPSWNFLTNYTHVLVCLSRDHTLTVRELALQIGITERSIQRILRELETGGVISRCKDGRNNTYKIMKNHRLHHPLERSKTVAELLKAIS